MRGARAARTAGTEQAAAGRSPVGGQRCDSRALCGARSPSLPHGAPFLKRPYARRQRHLLSRPRRNP